MLHGVVSVQGSPASSAGVQADGPPVGSLELTTWPVESTATQSDADGQAIELRLRPLSIVVCVHAPDAGSVETSSAPDEPTAKQSAVDGQAMPTRLSATTCFVQLPAPGAVVVWMFCPSTETQKVVVGHVPDSKGGVLVLTVHALAGPVGSAEVKTVRELSVMKHSGCAEQKTAFNDRLLSIALADQAPVPPEGLVETATLPSRRVATQRLVDGQFRSFTYDAVPPSAVDVHADAPPVGLVEV
jgi:hypothetical protein